MSERVEPADRWIAAGLALAVLGVLLSTADIGFVRDEGYYFRAAREYHAWFGQLAQAALAGHPLEAMSDAVVRKAFGYNTEHPGFVKILMGFTWRLSSDVLGWTSNATGYRLASMLLVAIGVAFTYLFGQRAFGRPVGVLAVALLVSAPHVFFHAHLACFDGPIMGLTIAVVYAFWRALTSRGWVIAAGLLWGVALATKHNAVFLGPVLLLAYGLARADAFRWTRGGLALPPLPSVFLAMLLLGPVVFYVCYPFGWHDPVQRIGDYYRYHLHHEHYPVDYFGTLYVGPPFPPEYPFVMTVLTLPPALLLPGVAGLLWIASRALRALRHARAGVPVPDGLGDWLLVLNTVVPPLIIAMPGVPIFGGTKHWMPMMPFFCVGAAAVLWPAVAHVATRPGRGGPLAAALLLTLPLGLSVHATARTHPYGHTYFSELIGAHQGAAELGLPRTFWGGDARALLEVLNRDAERGAPVFAHRMNQDSFFAYQRDGLLRSDLRYTTDVRAATWALVNHQREYQDAEHDVWTLKSGTRGEAVIEIDGVPIASLYRLR